MNVRGIHLMLVLVLVVLLGSVTALAVRLTSDADGERPGPPVAPPIPPEPLPFMGLIDRVTVEGPYTERGMSVFVLTVARPEDGVDYLTLDQGLTSGQIVIQEYRDRRMDELRVRNLSKRFAFLMAGELVSGGMQNRTVREDMLLPPGGSAWLRLPVFCVEERRWKGGEEVDSAKAAAPGSLRSGLNQGYDQERLWQGVRTEQAEQGIASETGDVNQVYRDQKTSQAIREMTEAVVKRLPERRQCVGLAIASGERVVAADVFANSVLYGRLYGKIIQAHAADLYRVGTRERVLSAGEVREFLRRVHGASTTVRPATSGEGETVDIRGNGIAGRALQWSGRCVHVALFPQMVRPFPLEKQEDGR